MFKPWVIWWTIFLAVIVIGTLRAVRSSKKPSDPSVRLRGKHEQRDPLSTIYNPKEFRRARR